MKFKRQILKSSVLHFSVFQNRPNRGPLICSKIGSKRHVPDKKIDNDAILLLRNVDPRKKEVVLLASESLFLGFFLIGLVLFF